MSALDKFPLARQRSAVITVSYGSGEVLDDFLRTLREFHDHTLTVIVVDNKPDHENVQDVAERFNAEYLPLASNPGYGAGMNAGVAALSGQFETYFFCNPDVSFLSPAVDALASTLLSDASTGSVGPRLLNDDGSVYASARNIPSIGTGGGHALLGKLWPGNPWTRAYQNASHYDQRRPAGSLSGAAVMVKHEVFEQIGGWDEAYFMHFEDIDLGYRIGRAGYQNLFDPAVSVHHSGAHSTKKHAAVVERAMTASAIRFMNKRYSGLLKTPLRVAIAWGLRARGALRLRRIARTG